MGKTKEPLTLQTFLLHGYPSVNLEATSADHLRREPSASPRSKGGSLKARALAWSSLSSEPKLGPLRTALVCRHPRPWVFKSEHLFSARALNFTNAHTISHPRA